MLISAKVLALRTFSAWALVAHFTKSCPDRRCDDTRRIDERRTLPEGFYNFSDICVPVDLFTPSLYKFDVTGKNIEDDHTMDHEHNKNILFIDEYILIS